MNGIKKTRKLSFPFYRPVLLQPTSPFYSLLGLLCHPGLSRLPRCCSHQAPGEP